MKKFLSFILFFSVAHFLHSQEADNINCVQQKEGEDIQFPYDNFFIQRSYPDYGNILPALENAKQIARDQMAHSSRAQNFNLQWQLEGPTNIGGRVNVVTVDPTNANIIYEGTAGGGVFKTINGGTTWFSVVDTLSYFAVGDIKIDPIDHNIVYVGLGDPNISGYPAIGNGIIKSTDGGATWHNIGLSNTRIISKIEIHPLNNNIVYAGAMGLPYAKDNNRGLYKSNDGGQTWNQVLFVSDSAGVIDLLLDNTDTNIVYAVSWNRIRQNLRGLIAGPDAKIWKSINGGNTWTQLTNGLPTGTTFSRIAIAKSATNHNKLYAEFVDSANLDIYGVYKSTDGGASWTALNVGAIQGQVQGGFGWYFGNLTVNPYNDNDIYVLGVDLWNTTDNGAHWNQVGPPWWTYQVHADKHCLRFVNSTTMLLCTDGGLFKSTDTGNNWSDADEVPNSQFYHVSFNPHQAGTYFGGAQDNGTTSGNSGSLNTWPRVYGGDGFQQRFNPTSNMIYYTETQNGAIVYTDDGGFSFNDATAGIDPNDHRNWDMPYIISNSSPTTLYTGTIRMYKNTGNYIPNWQPVSNTLINTPHNDSTFRSISTIDESPVNTNLVYAGTSDGNVWRSADAGTNWQNITSTLPNRYVTKLKASDIHQNVVFQSNSGYKDNDNIPHIHMSVDSGATWTDISGDLPPFAVNDIELTHLNDSLIFVATDGGVYFTLNMGVNWSRLGTNMPLFVVYDIELDEASKKMIAGTFARSMWSINVDSILSFNSTLNLAVSANDTICQGATAQLSASGGVSYSWSPAGTLSCSTCPNPIATPNTTTTYTVTATNGANSAVDSITVFVNPSPTVSVSQSNDTLYTTTGYTYQWYFNGTLITGATDYFYVATATGNYYVVVTNQYNCSNPSNTLNVVISGIGNLRVNDAFSVYPNPFSDKFTVQKFASGDWKMSVRDISGREMFNSTISSSKSEYDLSRYSSGTYFIELMYQGAKFTKRVIKF